MSLTGYPTPAAETPARAGGCYPQHHTPYDGGALTTAARIQEFFESVAEDWDDMRLAYYDESVIEKMALRSGANGSMQVVDVGAGTGFVAAGMASRVESVIGVDNSPAMLARARRNLDSLGISNVDLVESSIFALPLADGSVDAACANMVLHHAEDPAAMLAEMSRVVKPGGAVVITDEVEHPYEWMRHEHADAWLGFSEDHIERLFSEAGLTAYGYESLGMQ